MKGFLILNLSVKVGLDVLPLETKWQHCFIHKTQVTHHSARNSHTAFVSLLVSANSGETWVSQNVSGNWNQVFKRYCAIQTIQKKILWNCKPNVSNCQTENSMNSSWSVATTLFTEANCLFNLDKDCARPHGTVSLLDDDVLKFRSVLHAMP